SLDMWTDTIGYTMSVDDVLVIESPPTANNDSFSALSGLMLSVPAPGVLTNDIAGSGSNLTAVLVTGPTPGSLALNANGSFTYTPPATFVGTNTFTYRANDGLSNSGIATVIMSVLPAVPLFSDDFTRGTDPAALSLPWVVQSGNWSVTGGALKGGTNTLMSYAFAYITNSWTNYSVQARLRFLTNGFGGGLGLCL